MNIVKKSYHIQNICRENSYKIAKCYNKTLYRRKNKKNSRTSNLSTPSNFIWKFCFFLVLSKNHAHFAESYFIRKLFHKRFLNFLTLNFTLNTSKRLHAWHFHISTDSPKKVYV